MSDTKQSTSGFSPAALAAARRELVDALRAISPTPDSVIVDESLATRLDNAWDRYEAVLRDTWPQPEPSRDQVIQVLRVLCSAVNDMQRPNVLQDAALRGARQLLRQVDGRPITDPQSLNIALHARVF
jgi:hypothetical protein